MTRYDISQTYDWNYENAPQPPEGMHVPRTPGEWRFCGLPVDSPIGIPAGPLLNSRWILYYAALGFDSLTYKTVRSSYRACYAPPNLLPVQASGALTDEGSTLAAAAEGDAFDTWAISFGMPSKAPETWQADVERARKGLGAGKVLSVSVVASPSAGWTMRQVAEDFAVCARWAVDAGAHVVEANLSCPNVCTQEADLYLSADAAAEIASTLRARIGATPLALKVGLFPGPDEAEALIRAVSPFAQAVSATNSITALVRDADNQILFGGLRRGIGGRAIAERCNHEMAMLARIVRDTGSKLELIGVGGVSTTADVRERLAAGAGHVHLATAPMIDPEVGLRIREELAG